MYVGRIFPPYFCINACGKNIFFSCSTTRYTHGHRHRSLLISLDLQVWATPFRSQWDSGSSPRQNCLTANICCVPVPLLAPWEIIRCVSPDSSWLSSPFCSLALACLWSRRGRTTMPCVCFFPREEAPSLVVCSSPSESQQWPAQESNSFTHLDFQHVKQAILLF